MTATTAFLQGTDTNQTEISYAQEAVWGTLPAVAFKALRVTGESLVGSKTRDRPKEINKTRSGSAAITTQTGAGGSIPFALSYGTNDDILSGVLGGDWSTNVAIAGVAGDLVFVAAGNHITSTLAGKFANVTVGQWLKISGTATNNGYAHVTAKTSDMDITVSGITLVNETPAGAAASLGGSRVTNGTTFKGFHVQKRLGAAGTSWLRYPGTYFSAATLTAGVGQFLSGSLTAISASEAKAIADASTGPVIDAPDGKIIDPIGGFRGLFWKGVEIVGVVDNLSLNITNEGAAGQYGLGKAGAQGIMPGVFGGTASFSMAFMDFTLYDDAMAETSGAFSFRVQDDSGSSYVFTMPAAVLLNPKITAGAPGGIVKAEFEVELNPDANGVHLQIDRFSA